MASNVSPPDKRSSSSVRFSRRPRWIACLVALSLLAAPPLAIASVALAPCRTARDPAEACCCRPVSSCCERPSPSRQAAEAPGSLGVVPCCASGEGGALPDLIERPGERRDDARESLALEGLPADVPPRGASSVSPIRLSAVVPRPPRDRPLYILHASLLR